MMTTPKICSGVNESVTSTANLASKETNTNSTLDLSQILVEGVPNAESNVAQTSTNDEINNSPNLFQKLDDINVSDTPESLDGSKVDPEVGMLFNSEEQAFKFYNSYAKRKGFSVRKGHLSRRKDGTIRDRHYLCSNEGTRKEHRTHITKKPRALERTNCLARIEFKVNRDSVWVINKFLDDHNHPLASPNKIHMLRSHRTKLPAQHTFITEMDYIGVKPTQVYESHRESAHSDENSGFISKNQSYNLLGTNRMKDLEKGDSQFFLDFFKAKQMEDPSFFYAVQVDENDRVTNYFWADARSILDYTCFGDALLLDTTYRASRYDIPFAPFIGVNHHKQMVIFGAALLLDESTESFAWLFKTFLAAMNGRQPRTILTDISDSLSRAISMTLPGTYHQHCIWHIIPNAPKILPHVYGHESNFQKEFESWIFESRCEEDIQNGRENLYTKYNLTGNSWFEQLYSSREKWSSVYSKNPFCASMTTKQWCETVGNQIKMLFYRKLPPSKFMPQYHEALAQLRAKESSADYESRKLKPVLVADVPMLIEASESYTRTVYKEFEVEYKSQLACLCEPVEMKGTICTFRVSYPQKRSYGLVEYDTSNALVTCSCKKYETMGVLCMHALKVLNYNNILHLPPCYVLKRWTKFAKDGVESANSYDGDELGLKCGQVCRKAMMVAVKTAFSKDGLEVLERRIDRFMDRMVYEMHNDGSSKQIDDINVVDGMQQNDLEAANICFDGF